MRISAGLERTRRRVLRIALPIGVTLALGLAAGCPTVLPSPDGGLPIYNNTTDRTNDGATYVGAAACTECHPVIAARLRVHGHAHKLSAAQDRAPTDGAGWVANKAARDRDDSKPRRYSGFVSDATVPAMSGTFAEPGIAGEPCRRPGSSHIPNLSAREMHLDPAAVTCNECHYQPFSCESCHGPGSNHVPDAAARDVYVDTTAVTCNECHDRPFDSNDGVIRARGGFIRHHEQWPELQASGGHSSLNCLICHDPHASPNHDRENAIINECPVCHWDQNMTRSHENTVFVRGDYTEMLNCESCHMPYASKSGPAATADIVGQDARMGDVRTHIFRINATDADYTAMFTTDGRAVAVDAQGSAAISLDFVCLRCHNGIGNAVTLTLTSAASLASGIHSHDTGAADGQGTGGEASHLDSGEPVKVNSIVH